MRIRSITFLFIVFLLLSSLAVPVIASGCDPECEGCQTCNEGVCEDDDSKCDTENCYECVSGDCEYQCDSIDYFCCDGDCCPRNARCCSDGTCASCCYEEEDEATCSSVNNTPCPACVGILGDCSEFPTLVYTNVLIYDCIESCTGDCDDVDPPPVCYSVYKCTNYIYYLFAECGTGGEIPGPLDCYGGDMP